MDNQQATIRLAWLGGVIDSDGCISMTKSDRWSRYVIGTVLVITNTNELFIEIVASILKDNGLDGHVSWRQVSSNSSWNRKPFGTVTIGGHKRCYRALTVLRPYIFAKRDQVELVLEFLESRLRYDRPGPNPYSDRDWEIFQAVKDLKHVGASETTRVALQSSSDDIVQAVGESHG